MAQEHCTWKEPLSQQYCQQPPFLYQHSSFSAMEAQCEVSAANRALRESEGGKGKEGREKGKGKGEKGKRGKRERGRGRVRD